MDGFLHDILNVLGVTDGGGRWYLWWSGMFSNLTIFAGMVVFYRKHNCHVHGCLRIGTHKAVDANGTEHMVCRTHHPDLAKKHRLHPHMLMGQPPPDCG
jgi:hypothetical protein